MNKIVLDEYYYWPRILSIVITAMLAIATHLVVKANIDRRKLRPEIADIFHGVYLFLGALSGVGWIRLLSNALHGQTSILLSNCLVMARDAAGFYLFGLLVRVLVKQKADTAWAKKHQSLVT